MFAEFGFFLNHIDIVITELNNEKKTSDSNSDGSLTGV